MAAGFRSMIVHHREATDGHRKTTGALPRSASTVNGAEFAVEGHRDLDVPGARFTRIRLGAAGDRVLSRSTAVIRRQPADGDEDLPGPGREGEGLGSAGEQRQAIGRFRDMTQGADRARALRGRVRRAKNGHDFNRSGQVNGIGSRTGNRRSRQPRE
jgi:hypothetical protein